MNSMLYLGLMYTLVIFRVRGPGDGVRRIKIKRTLAYAFKILFVEPCNGGQTRYYILFNDPKH